MAAIVDNLIRTKRAAAVLLEDARKAAALPMEIFFAGMTGDSEAVFEWLNRGGDINAGEEVTQATLLIAAAVTGAALPLEVLIAKGSAVDRRDSHGLVRVRVRAYPNPNPDPNPSPSPSLALALALTLTLTGGTRTARPRSSSPRSTATPPSSASSRRQARRCTSCARRG